MDLVDLIKHLSQVKFFWDIRTGRLSNHGVSDTFCPERKTNLPIMQKDWPYIPTGLQNIQYAFIKYSNDKEPCTLLHLVQNSHNKTKIIKHFPILHILVIWLKKTGNQDQINKSNFYIFLNSYFHLLQYKLYKEQLHKTLIYIVLIVTSANKCQVLHMITCPWELEYQVKIVIFHSLPTNVTVTINRVFFRMLLIGISPESILYTLVLFFFLMQNPNIANFAPNIIWASNYNNTVGSYNRKVDVSHTNCTKSLRFIRTKIDI